MQDCANRISNCVQITTDGHKPYLEAVENAFGTDIDYAQLHKIYDLRLTITGATLRQPALAVI